MIVQAMRITLLIPWAKSLKDKRQVARSIMEKVRRTFGVSIAEVDTQDMHQRLTLGLATVSGDAKQAAHTLDAALAYVESHTDAEVISVEPWD